MQPKGELPTIKNRVGTVLNNVCLGFTKISGFGLKGRADKNGNSDYTTKGVLLNPFIGLKNPKPCARGYQGGRTL